MSLQSSFSTAIDLLANSDEEKEVKKDLLLACVLVGKYLSNKEERPTFYIRKSMEWERHNTELTSEGPQAFQKMYRMEYSNFLKLCTIIKSRWIFTSD